VSTAINFTVNDEQFFSCFCNVNSQSLRVKGSITVNGAGRHANIILLVLFLLVVMMMTMMRCDICLSKQFHKTQTEYKM